jgi:hypothetical protein
MVNDLFKVITSANYRVLMTISETGDINPHSPFDIFSALSMLNIFQRL